MKKIEKKERESQPAKDLSHLQSLSAALLDSAIHQDHIRG